MKHKLRWALMLYDLILYLLGSIFIIILYPSTAELLTLEGEILNIAAGFVCLYVFRLLFKIYTQIWRYAGSAEYIRLIASDVIAWLVFLLTRRILPQHITFVRATSLFAVNLLACIMIREIYQWMIYQKKSGNSRTKRIIQGIFKILPGVYNTEEKAEPTINKIKIAIIGAGSIGAMLAEELIRNPKATYKPVCFVDIDKGKAGREIYGIPVLSSEKDLQERLSSFAVQEVVFALPNVTAEKKTNLYSLYKSFGYKVKAYDYPILNTDEESGKRQIHDFAIEDLLSRSAASFLDQETMDWYSGKSVLITGGGGSIGAELARQIARCKPSRLAILDVYENGAYDIQQELRTRYGDELNLRVEIANICDKEQINKIFREHTPDIVFHAAAHKHVPLMERNVCEAVSNNVFGTLNVVEASEKYGVKRFIMISTDKAVNPTNVMGATKRLCEMIIQSRCSSVTSFSATRFGNVLGSNGSVIPLFSKQIANGGPITITDKRIIRYFMTIPEACQLVMTSGAMAGNGDLYALDMGSPVKILDLAENMIKLSGLEPYKDIEIVEIGLRPGEKLYEELLIKTEELDKTDNNMIFIERDKALDEATVATKLEVLRNAMETQSNRIVKKALMEVVPTYHTPEEVNERAIESEEMKSVG